VSGVADAFVTARALARAGVLRPEGPRRTVAVARTLRQFGRGLAGAAAVNALRDPDAICLVDELGPVTHGELGRRSGHLAGALREEGVGPGDSVGLLCRDHRYFLEAAVAIAKLGANLLLLNTAFSGPQLQGVLERERPRALVYDAEFEGLVAGTLPGVARVVAWADGEDLTAPTIDELVSAGRPQPPPPPGGPGRTILLTSGTTGTPKGARRAPEAPTSAVASVLDRIPMRVGQRHFVAAPMFHAWGFAHMGLGILLRSEIVVRRRFDAEATLETIARVRPHSVAMVPVMAQRILELPAEVRERYDTSSLKVIALGGSAIPGDLAIRLMNAFGDIVYNAYGSTEVAIVSIAGPADLRADPATAGPPVRSVVTRLLDSEGRDRGKGPGQIYVGSEAAFEGYTGGGTKDLRDGLMATGDIGTFDAYGRLRIEGRDDDMIVSGGENVYPREVEDTILGLPGVQEAAVVGVEDAEFGQRLRAFVVRAGGASLSADDVKDAVRSSLARYKVPRDVVFVDELPRTATGKILKRELQAQPS
jgi:acyl-CoA synthetase (AMP-forming)/AMP-acid ligase II